MKVLGSPEKEDVRPRLPAPSRGRRIMGRRVAQVALNRPGGDSLPESLPAGTGCLHYTDFSRAFPQAEVHLT